MISVSEFYSALGVDGEVPEGDYVVVDEKVQVMAKSNEVTLIFASINPGPRELKRLFEVSRTIGEAVPFTTKSGKLAMKILCNTEDMQTTSALAQTESSLQLMLAD
jgi:hypothetical protein